MSPVVDAVDPEALLARVDLDDLVDRVDLDAALARIDVARLIDRIDVNALLQRVDVAALVARIDVNALLETVDVDALLQRVDVDDVVQRVDVDGIVQRVDVAAVVERVDVESVAQRVDVSGIVDRVRVGDVVSDSATQIVTRSLDRARLTVAGLDRGVLRLADHVSRRATTTDPARYAGPFSRLGAWFLDSAIATASFSVAVAIGAYLVALFAAGNVDATPGGSPWWVAAGTAWLGFYLFVSLFLAQRTPGMAVLGIRVARGDGSELRARHALVRVVVLPFSFVLGLGFVGLVFGRRRRALHDVAAGTVVVVDDIDAGRTSSLTPGPVVAAPMAGGPSTT